MALCFANIRITSEINQYIFDNYPLVASLHMAPPEHAQICFLLLYSLINALKQPEIEVVTGLLWSATVVYEHQSGGICLSHLNTNTRSEQKEETIDMRTNFLNLRQKNLNFINKGKIFHTDLYI